MSLGSIPYIQIRSNCLIYYELEQHYDGRHHGFGKKGLHSINTARATAYSQDFSDGSKKRLTKSIDLLVQATKSLIIYNPVTKSRHRHRLSFITLTVSSDKIIPAQECHKKLLYPFIQWLRRTMKVTTYIWKVEFQKRGQTHYHITTPSFIPYQSIRDKWNNLQKQHGYTDDYFNEKGHYNPNSTDIGEVKKVKNMSSYLKKEYCKSIQNSQIKVSKISNPYKASNIENSQAPLTQINYRQWKKSMSYKTWDCSLNLKKWKLFTTQATDPIHKAIIEMNDRGLLTMEDNDFCSVIKIKDNQFTSLLPINKIAEYDDMIKKICTYRKE